MPLLDGKILPCIQRTRHKHSPLPRTRNPPLHSLAPSRYPTPSIPLQPRPSTLHSTQHRIQLITHRVPYQPLTYPLIQLNPKPIPPHHLTRTQPTDHFPPSHLLIVRLFTTSLPLIPIPPTQFSS